MAIPLNDIETWLNDEGISDVYVNWMPDQPAAAVVISGAGGEPPILDGAYETTHIHVRTRAATDAAAEAQAVAVHKLITGRLASFTAGSTYVMTVRSTSGPPCYFNRDVDQRTTYIATYAFTCPTA